MEERSITGTYASFHSHRVMCVQVVSSPFSSLVMTRTIFYISEASRLCHIFEENRVLAKMSKTHVLSLMNREKNKGRNSSVTHGQHTTQYKVDFCGHFLVPAAFRKQHRGENIPSTQLCSQWYMIILDERKLKDP